MSARRRVGFPKIFWIPDFVRKSAEALLTRHIFGFSHTSTSIIFSAIFYGKCSSTFRFGNMSPIVMAIYLIRSLVRKLAVPITYF